MVGAKIPPYIRVSETITAIYSGFGVYAETITLGSRAVRREGSTPSFPM